MDVPRQFDLLPLVMMAYLSMIEQQATNDARHVVLDFIRQEKHWQMGMTHVCCRLLWGSPIRTDFGPSPEDIDEILEEEEEFMHMLDTDMALLADEPFEDLVDHWMKTILVSQRMVQAQRRKEVSEWGF